ncbi:MAG: penicillin acylase family protein [Ignavibacteria bacterium]|nr:penicillin acylase family protein [Ignavibacteria bacterium]
MGWKKTLIILPAAVLILLSAFAAIAYFSVKSYVPAHEGKDKVKGLDGNVKIYFDENEVPHIFADDFKSAAFSLGYIHAGERMFQMDMIRRAGQGRLSEIFGGKTLAFDKMFRTIGLYKHVKENLKKYDKETIEILEAYSKGINECIRKNANSLSVEFDLLNYNPEPWKPEHSLLIAKLLSWELNISWWTDIAYTHLAQKLGKDSVKYIIPDYEENMPYIIPQEIKKIANADFDFINTAKNFRNFIGWGNGTHIGSNNWAVSGSRSESGKPIIANDPHLSFQTPAKWYIADIHTPEFNVSGFMLPGIPVVVIGKNSSISWVVTNCMADDCDFYSETFDSTGKKYLFNNEWKNLKVAEETITVKDSASVKIEIKKTHRGPVISENHVFNSLYPDPVHKKNNISMRWTALDFSDEIGCFIKVNKAKNYSEFKVALSNYNSPAQNFVYADSTGNIAYIFGGRLPIREVNSISFIYDGTTDKYDWQGFVPFGEMPEILNPAEGFIASANNKTVKNFGYHISNMWEPSSRIKRINQLLSSKQRHSSADFKKYQNDFKSLYAEEITKYLINAFDSNSTLNGLEYHSLELLKKWDYKMPAGSQVPAIFEVFFNKLLENTYKDQMNENLFKEFCFIENVPYRSIQNLLQKNDTLWFDNVKTKKKETRDEILRLSFSQAVKQLEKNFGKDISLWQWGELHKLTLKHFFHGESPMTDKIFDIGTYPIGGSGTTVFNTEYSFNGSYETELGPSMRYIFDFAEPAYFECILPSGQSGHTFSNYYSDMTEKWLEGKYIKVYTERNWISDKNSKLLELIPEGN